VSDLHALDRAWGRPVRLSLIAIVSASILALAFITATTLGIPFQRSLQVVFVVGAIALAAVDFRSLAAIAILELVVGGASGHWTALPGGPSGRIVLDGIVTLSAAWILFRRWRREGRLDLGRYAPHALVAGAVMVVVWMSLGLINGNRAANVFGDGDVNLFFAFTLVLLVLIQDGYGAWLRRWLLVACTVNAIVLFGIVVLTAPGFLPLYQTFHAVLSTRLNMGGSVGYMANGAYRLYTGSGLYLQVGLALMTWELMQRPRRAWAWAVYLIMWIGVVATYTRGFWLSAIGTVAIVLVAGTEALTLRDVRRAGTVVAGSLALFMAASLFTHVAGFSLPSYLMDRTATVLETGASSSPGSPSPSESSPGATPTGPVATATPPPTGSGGSGQDVGGAYSNQVRATQATVLWEHISQSPIIGSGYGSIAADYPYGHSFSYELNYLDLLFKTGILGFLIFLSLPVRLVIDAFRGRLGHLSLPSGVTRAALAVPLAISAGVLLVSATNPYLLAAFGLFPILACMAWLEPGHGPVSAQVG
jgi:O-Antigen ligase